MAKAKAKKKKWTDNDEITLDHLYSSHMLEFKVLAARFNCSVAEIRRKLKEMDILQ